MILRPDWTGSPTRSAAGPVVVRDGGPVFRANEAFSSCQLAPRHPRTAVGQLADGRILLVVVDGRRPGYSVGMTNFELAQALVRLGAVTRLGARRRRLLDARLQRLVAEPALRSRRRAAGLGCAPAHVLRRLRADSRPVHLAERRRRRREAARSRTRSCARRTSPRRSSVRATCPPSPRRSTACPAPTRSRSRRRRSIRLLPPRRPPKAAGGSTSSATDDLGQTSTTSQAFTVNSTLGFAKLSRRSLAVRVRGKQMIQAGVTLTRPARVFATVETARGVASRRSPCAAFRRAASSRAGRDDPRRPILRLRRPATRSGSAPPTSSASWSSPPRPSA